MKMNYLIPSRFHIKYNTILLYLIIFFSADTYLFGTNSDEAIETFSRYLLIPICAFLFLRWSIKKQNLFGQKKKILYFFILETIFVFSSLVNNDSITYIVIKSLIICAAFLVTMLFSFDEFVTSFCESMFFISICAIILEILAYTNSILVDSLPGVIGTGEAVTKTCYLAGVLSDYLGTKAIRASGIFWEPGVFTIYLNIAIAFELFYKKQITMKYLIIEIIAVVITFSTTGYIVFIWQLLCYGFFGKRENDSKTRNTNRVATVLLITFFLLIVLFSTGIANFVFEKFTYVGGGSARKASVIINIQMALEHPLFGIGNELAMHDEFEKLTAESPYIYGWARDNTNTLLFLFAAYGIPFGLLITIGTYRFGKLISRGRKKIALIIFSILVLLYTGENLRLSTIPFIIVFYGYQRNKLHNHTDYQSIFLPLNKYSCK